MPPLVHRPRRLRRTEGLRALVRETDLQVDDLMAPLFVVPGRGVRRPISSLPGQAQVSVDEAVADAQACAAAGIRSLILFGVPDQKDEVGSEAVVVIREGLVRAIRIDVDPRRYESAREFLVARFGAPHESLPAEGPAPLRWDGAGATLRLAPAPSPGGRWVLELATRE